MNPYITAQVAQALPCLFPKKLTPEERTRLAEEVAHGASYDDSKPSEREHCYFVARRSSRRLATTVNHELDLDGDC